MLLSGFFDNPRFNPFHANRKSADETEPVVYGGPFIYPLDTSWDGVVLTGKFPEQAPPPPNPKYAEQKFEFTGVTLANAKVGQLPTSSYIFVHRCPFLPPFRLPPPSTHTRHTALPA